MDWYAPIARHVIIPLQARREGSRWPWYVEEIASWEGFSAEEIRGRQWEKLQALLRHAYENVAYYRRLFDERRLRASDIRTFGDLRLLPILTKQDILQHGDELVAGNFEPAQLVDAFTGGTTGIPMRFKRDRRCRDIHYAGMAAFSRWYGIEVGGRIAMVWGSQQDLIRTKNWRTPIADRLLRRAPVLNAYHMSNAEMRQFTQVLRRYRPAVVRGYPSAIELLAKFVCAAGIEGPVAAVVCTAEPVSAAQREAIERCLHTQVFDQYAGREFGLMATECAHHRGLHVNVASLHLEVMYGEVPASPGQYGRLVGTDLDGYGMPFIRYDLSDIGRWASDPCPCGRQLPVLASVEGRSSSMLFGTRGTCLSGTVLATTMGALDIPGQLQFVQEEDLGIEVRVVPGASFAASHEEAIRSTLAALLGSDMRVSFTHTAEIPRTASGKYLYTVSKADPERLLAQARNKAGLPT